MAPPVRLLVAACLLALALPASASASAAGLSDVVNQWLPDPDGASWTYQWSDAQYAPKPTREKYTLDSRAGTSFRLAWTTDGLGNGDGTQPGAGQVDYQRTEAGLLNVNWASTPPPPQFPILCASASQCANSLAGTHYMLIWGNRSPVLAEPLLQGTRWSALGGAGNDVGSDNRYEGTQRVVVPAFPKGILAAKVVSTITQAGALGDPYGSGLRTVWWVYGVGPVKIHFAHAGGDTSDAELLETSLKPRPAPVDTNYLPLGTGETARFRWTNTKHLRKPAVETVTVNTVVNNTARVDVKSDSGPINVAGTYLLSTRLNGITDLGGTTKAASLAKLPPLGPASAPKDRRRHFFTPLDLLLYGYNPVLPAYPSPGMTWRSAKGSADYKTFGVTGRTKVVGFVRRVTVPAGRFKALKVVSTLTQKGFPFGSGTRTSYFAAGVGLVKLVFRHRDGSVSTVERLR